MIQVKYLYTQCTEILCTQDGSSNRFWVKGELF